MSTTDDVVSYDTKWPDHRRWLHPVTQQRVIRLGLDSLILMVIGSGLVALFAPGLAWLGVPAGVLLAARQNPLFQASAWRVES